VIAGVIGAGGFASRILLPAFRQAGAQFKTIASRGGVSAVQAARRFGAQQATTDLRQVFADPEINTVIIATRHDSHADYCCRALAAGKHVFIEKPLCIDRAQLERVIAAQAAAPDCRVMVGFNRRFAPQVAKIAKLLRGVAEPKNFVMTVNAGLLPADHWTNDPVVGGGRMIGEGCHFVDLLRFLAGQPITDIQAMQLGDSPALSRADDKLVCTLRFADGSVGTIQYLGNGHRSFSKERLEVFCAGRVLQLDNFLRLRGFGWPGFRSLGLWKQDKGHQAEVTAFVEAVRTGGPAPIPFHELVEVTEATFEIVAQAAGDHRAAEPWQMTSAQLRPAIGRAGGAEPSVTPLSRVA
jgi:predicted dehydrogenase